MVTASDSRGGIADSPIFLLRVIPERRLGLLGTLDLWCTHLLLLELIAICVAAPPAGADAKRYDRVIPATFKVATMLSACVPGFRTSAMTVGCTRAVALL